MGEQGEGVRGEGEGREKQEQQKKSHVKLHITIPPTQNETGNKLARLAMEWVLLNDSRRVASSATFFPSSFLGKKFEPVWCVVREDVVSSREDIYLKQVSSSK